MKIILMQNSQPAQYAAEELAKYLFLIQGGAYPQVNFQDAFSESYDEKSNIDSRMAADTIYLGLLKDFGLSTEDVQDPVIEDVIDIHIEQGGGYIAGSNARSILQGVYIYLKSAGCMWVRPGVEGEYIPKKDLSGHSFTYRKKADYVFRGQCSEGAISYEHLRDMIYWLPKVGMNMFMNEGRVPFNYMHRWYDHVSNLERYEGNPSNYDAMLQYIDRVEADMLKTGVQYHNMGHGWMFEEFGLKNGNNLTMDGDIKEENKQYLALFRGKREFVDGVPFYTNLCYSNPKARQKLVDFWVKYALEKPYVDYFHVWLADGINCLCECEECRKYEISDLYVQLLNEIDEALTAIGSKARLVFILYKETIRPPKDLKINNPNRYMLLYARGGNYENIYTLEKFEGEEPTYVHNKMVVPSSALANKWRDDWKRKAGKTLSCTYEYRFYMDHYCDPGYMQVARETHRDMKFLRKMDFDGCMSDLTLRCFMPTGLPVAIMGETLFDSSLDFESYCKDYFHAAFGKDGAKCREYLEKMSELFSPNLLRHNVKVGSREEEGFMEVKVYDDSWYSNPKAAEGFLQVPALIEAFMPVIETNRKGSNICHNKSWDYLRYHAHIAGEMSKAYLAGAQGNMKKAGEIYLQLQNWISVHEMEIAPVFDLHLFDKCHRDKFGLKRCPEFG